VPLGETIDSPSRSARYRCARLEKWKDKKAPYHRKKGIDKYTSNEHIHTNEMERSSCMQVVDTAIT